VAAKKRNGSGQEARARAYFAQQREGGERDLILSGKVAPTLGSSAGAARTGVSDWRETLRNVDKAATSIPGPADVARVERARPPARDSVVARPDVAPARPAGAAPTKRAWHADLALEHIPVGLTVGSSSHDMFEGGRDSFASLAELERAVASCKRCALYRGAKNPVPGEGDPNADLMCVGEAPGATEDELGRPFVGQAGKLLTQILSAIGLPRERVYICNVLKHRPPNNRNPLPDEVTACTPYLVRQVELIRPKVILALGTFAAQTLLDTKSSMGKLREAIHQYHGIPCVVTYHPAALLRNPSWKRPTWEDVQLAHRLLDRAVAHRGP